MKSQKGISLMSLLIYVVAFLVISGIIAAITTFFYSNYAFLDDKVSISSEYNKLNLCFVQETEKLGNYIYKKGSYCNETNKTVCPKHRDGFYEQGETTDINNLHYESKLELLEDIDSRCKHFFKNYIIFYDENFIGWREAEKAIYYNQSILCKGVDKFAITQDNKNGKEVITVYVQFAEKSYSTKYTF